MSNKKRSIAKTITWRLTATVTTMLLVFIFTGRLDFAISIGSIEFFLKMILYYMHERTWNFISWGKS